MEIVCPICADRHSFARYCPNIPEKAICPQCNGQKHFSGGLSWVTCELCKGNGWVTREWLENEFVKIAKYYEGRGTDE